jgi:hypothetical protein
MDTRMTVSRSDILVQNYGSVVLLRSSTSGSRAWLEANCDWSGYQPFTGGTVLCEPRYVGDIVPGARQAGQGAR